MFGDNEKHKKCWIQVGAAKIYSWTSDEVQRLRMTAKLSTCEQRMRQTAEFGVNCVSFKFAIVELCLSNCFYI